MRVEQVMTERVWQCEPDASLRRVMAVMVLRDCGWVPVVQEGRLLGVLTDRDIAVIAWRTDRSLSDLVAADVMTRNVASCAPDDSIVAAELVMRARGVRRLAVLEQGHLAGVLSLDDLARHASQADCWEVPGLGAGQVLGLLCDIVQAPGRGQSEVLSKQPA